MHSEVMKRVVAILTESSQWLTPGAEEETNPSGEGLIGELINDVLRFELSLPHDATPTEIGEAVSEELSPRIIALVGSFAAAFHQLAVEHDRLTPEVTSADVLRDLAIRASGTEI